MAKTFPRRADDAKPGSGFRMVLNGTTYFLNKQEVAGAAQIAQLQKVLGATQQEIAEAIETWLVESRRARRWLFRK